MTKLQEANQRLYHTTTEHQQRRMLHKIAIALEEVLLIKQGTVLVSILGNGSECNNHEAIVTWVMREIKDLDAPVSQKLVPQLANRLHRVLTKFESDIDSNY